jgi:hypothetical protein
MMKFRLYILPIIDKLLLTPLKELNVDSRYFNYKSITKHIHKTMAKTITYNHPISRKTITDTVIAEDLLFYTVNRNHWHRVEPLQVLKSQVISSNSKN